MTIACYTVLWFIQQTIAACIAPYCTTGEDLQLAARYRVVVSTCISAGTLYSCGINEGHFTHVFVDEVHVYISSIIEVIDQLIYFMHSVEGILESKKCSLLFFLL